MVMTDKMCRVHGVLAVRTMIVLTVSVLLGGMVSSAQDTPPTDGCIVQLDVPLGVTISLNGESFRDLRSFTIRPLDLRRMNTARFVAKFPNGGQAERYVLTEPGKLIRLRIAQPSLVVASVAESKKDSAVGLIRMNPDGSGQQWLTRNFEDINPRISPDGDRIVFQRRKVPFAKNAPSDICVISSGGGEVTRLVDGKSPQWSPDGQRIIFLRKSESAEDPDPSDIYIMQKDGTEVRRLAQGTAPSMSPDGNRIAYIRGKGYTRSAPGAPPWVEFDSKRQVHLVELRDGATRQLTSNREWEFHQIVWAADGSRLICQLLIPENTTKTQMRMVPETIALLSPTDDQLRVLCRGTSPILRSPDGRHLSFPLYYKEGLGKIALDGKKHAEFYRFESPDESLDEFGTLCGWSPDGAAVLYVRNIINLDDETSEKNATDLIVIPTTETGKIRSIFKSNGFILGADWS